MNDRDKRATPPNSGAFVWDGLSFLLAVGVMLAIAVTVALVANPQLPINPYPPVVVIATVQFPTFTPSSTAPPTETPQPSGTPEPTFTATPSPTATETATPGPSPTATIYSIFPFMVRGEPAAIAGSAFPDHEECKLWVAGQAYDLQGAPMVGITVQVGGYLGRRTLVELSLTGTALQYGRAGYEFTLAEEAMDSSKTVWIRLLDQSGAPLSGQIFFDTYADCQRNLILINFRQVK